MFCTNCGKVTDSVKFCAFCGVQVSDQIVLDTEKNNIKEEVTNTVAKSTKINTNVYFKKILNYFNDKDTLIKSLICVGIAFGTALILAFILQVSIFDKLIPMKLMQQDLDFLSFPGVEKLLSINVLDIINLSLLNKFIFFASLGTEGSIGLTAKLSILILLLIPIISFTAANFITLKNKTSTKNNIKLYLFNSSIFSIFISLLNLLFSKSLKSSESALSLLDININVSGKFSVLYGFFIIFTITFIIQVLLNIIYTREKLHDLISFKVTKESINLLTSVIKGIFILSSIVTIVFIIKLSASAKFTLTYIILIPNLLVYSFSMFLLSPIKIVMQGISVDYSFFVFKNSVNSSLQSSKIFGIIALISLIYLIYKNIYKINKPNYIKDYAIFAGLLTVFNEILVFLTISKLSIAATLSDDMNGSMMFGFSFLSTFFISFILISAIGGLCYLIDFLIDKHLKNNELLNKIATFNNQYKKYITIGLLFLFFILAILTFKLPNSQNSISLTNPTNTTGQVSKDSSYIDNYLIFQDIKYINSNNYLIVLNNKVYKTNIKNRKVTNIYDLKSGEAILKCENDKIFISNSNKINIIDLKGKDLGSIDINAFKTISTYNDSNYIIIKSEKTSLYNIKDKRLINLDFDSSNLVWKDKDNLIYIIDSEMYSYNASKNSTQKLNIKADFVSSSNEKVYYGVNEEVTESGKKVTYTIIKDLKDNKQIFKVLDFVLTPSAPTLMFSKDGSTMLSLQNELNSFNGVLFYLDGEKFTAADEYISKTFDIRGNEILTLSPNSTDIFKYDITTGQWSNLSLDFNFIFKNVKDGDTNVKK